MDDEKLQKMLNSGELSVMTECAYGEAIADDEIKHKIKLKKKKNDKNEEDE